MCASHTGAIAGSAGTWRSLLKQAGAIQAESMSELVDISARIYLFATSCRKKRRRRLALVEGVGVQAADDVIRAGLQLPMLHGDVRRKLNDIYGTEAGSHIQEPG